MAQYIDKDIIVAELKHRIKESDKLADAAADNNLHNVLEANELLIRQYTSLLNYLDTLEVKEVDLEKEFDLEEEIDKELDENWYGEYINHEKFGKSAKHFYELGLNAKKGNKL